MRNQGAPADCGRIEKRAAAKLHAVLSARNARTAKIPNSSFLK